jgi:hypothetical protein
VAHTFLQDHVCPFAKVIFSSCVVHAVAAIQALPFHHCHDAHHVYTGGFTEVLEVEFTKYSTHKISCQITSALIPNAHERAKTSVLFVGNTTHVILLAVFQRLVSTSALT